MGFEIRIRNKAIEGMDEVHTGCCSYPTSAHPNGYLDPTYWDQHGDCQFIAKSPLPSGKYASDAIEAIFAPGAGTELECLTMTVAIEYYALLKGLGKTKFNQKFPGGSGLIIAKNTAVFGGDIIDKEYDAVTATINELIPGDWVYFKNFHDYPVLCGGLWRGENCIVMDDKKFRGFGARTLTGDVILTEAQMNDELVRAFNTEKPSSMPNRTVSDLLADGGGFQSSPVWRPNIKKILS